MPNGRQIGSRGTLLISENVKTNWQSTSAEALPAGIRRDGRPLQVTPYALMLGYVVGVAGKG